VFASWLDFRYNRNRQDQNKGEKPMKKILIVSASPRKNSNSEALALAFAEGARSAGHEVDFVSLRGKEVNFCRGCFVCQEKLRCVIRDDADAVCQKALGADVLSVITPSFAAASQNELYSHYMELSEAVDLPIVLYNIPARTGNALAPATVAKLAKNAENIVARFGSAGAQIGKSTGQHVVIDQDSLDIMNGETTLATFGETAVIGQRNNAGSMNIFLGKSESYNPGITQIIRWVDRLSDHPYFTAIHDRNNGNDYVIIGIAGGTYPGYGDYSVALGSFSWQTAGSFGKYSIAEGKDACARGEASHAQNLGTIAAKRSQTAMGVYNEEDTSSTTTHPSGDARYGDYALIIGNGSSDSSRSNALTVGWDGTVTHDGDVPWTNLPLTSSVVAFSDGQVPMYRKWGPVVTLCGAFKMTSAQSADFVVQIGQLPVGCRPKRTLDVLCQGSNREVWLLDINESGVVRASRYRKGDTLVAVTTSTWFPFTATFLVA
jgi:hypothetical protein